MRLNFICRKCKVGRNGLAPLELSIIQNGERTVLTLEHRIDIKKWDSSKQRVRANKVANDYIEAISKQLMGIEISLISKGKDTSLTTIVDVFKNGFNEEKITILGFFNDWLKHYATDPTMTLMQYNKYKRTLGYLERYCNGTDININEITPMWIEGFYSFLIKSGNKNNTANTKMKHIKRILRTAKEEGIISTMPFTMKLHNDKLTYETLSLDEIKKIREKTFATDRLNKIRDCVVVALYTGLAYTDLKTLTKENVQDKVIIKRRNKTDIQATIPLFPFVKEILERWNYKLPVPSNQRMNEYLAEIIDICQINKHITCHSLRHTYATILLNNGVDLTTVSKCCGHSNTLITQSVYAQMQTKTIVDTVSSIADKII